MMAAPCIYLWVDVYVFAIIFIIQTLNQPVTHTSFTPTLQGLKQKKLEILKLGSETVVKG